MALALHSPPELAEFAECCAQQVQPADYPLAQSVEKNILCYSGDTLRQAVQYSGLRTRLLQELAKGLQYGPGVLVVTAAFTDSRLLDRHNQLFEQILQREAGQQGGDHFAKTGANGRIWNAFQKVALTDPEAFLGYYQNPVLQLVAEAWLGPRYQLTSQVNIVRPGGEAQQPHRDYHLGFQSAGILAQYPPHAHAMSALLTLQGAVAHTDMPLDSGPTQLLPFSQQYPQGYLAWREPAFIDYFKTHYVQLALQQGDAVFFSPALFHAAGENRTQRFQRIANLLQISSAFGRAMETVDQYAISVAVYPVLRERFSGLTTGEQNAVLEAVCEGYAFPTNLDRDPPVSGRAPQTHRQLTETALLEHWSPAAYAIALRKHQTKKEV